MLKENISGQQKTLYYKKVISLVSATEESLLFFLQTRSKRQSHHAFLQKTTFWARSRACVCETGRVYRCGEFNWNGVSKPITTYLHVVPARYAISFAKRKWQVYSMWVCSNYVILWPQIHIEKEMNNKLNMVYSRTYFTQ